MRLVSSSVSPWASRSALPSREQALFTSLIGLGRRDDRHSLGQRDPDDRGPARRRAPHLANCRNLVALARKNRGEGDQALRPAGGGRRALRHRRGAAARRRAAARSRHSDAIRARAVAPQVDLPPLREWLTSLVPPNPVKAAADGTLLPFVVFIVFFALALTRIDEESRQTVVRFFDAIERTMFVLVTWIIRLSPFGVFALGLGLTGRGGVGVASAVGLYAVLVAGLLTIATAALYPVAAIAARVPLQRFVRACAPVQAIAFSTRSSFASLPVLIDRAERALGVNPEVSGVVLPVAVSVFKFGMPILRVAGTCFIARLFGVSLEWSTLLALAGALVVGSFYTPVCRAAV